MVSWATSTAPIAVPPAPTVTPSPVETPGPSATLQAGLLLSPASEVIPKKLVDKIRSGHFLEMKDLLADNISLLSQLEALQGPGPGPMQFIGATRPRLREVSSLPSWCYCFLGFMAAMTSDPVTRDQLAYARLIIKEAQRHGGLSWLDYDRAFRQQIAADPAIRWNILNPSLLASTMMGYRSTGQGSFCTLCRMVDHTRAHCALAYLEHPYSGPPAQRQFQQVVRKPRGSPICFAWNRGSCSFAGRCNFRHVCSTCQNPGHKSAECTHASTRPPVMLSLPSSNRP